MAPAFVRTIGRGTLPWYCFNGLGLAFCLMANGIFDRVVSQRSSVATFAVRISADDPLTGGLTAIAACAVLALAALRCHRELRVGYVAGAVGASVQVVCLTGIYLASGGAIPLGLGTAAGLVLGAASMLFLALWAQLLAHSGLHRALTVLAVALAADTLFDLASALLVEGTVVALSAVAFAAGPLLLAAAFSAEKALGMAGDPGAGGSPGAAAAPAPDGATHVTSSAHARRRVRPHRPQGRGARTSGPRPLGGHHRSGSGHEHRDGPYPHQAHLPENRRPRPRGAHGPGGAGAVRNQKPASESTTLERSRIYSRILTNFESSSLIFESGLESRLEITS